MGPAIFRGADGSPRLSLAALATTSFGTIMYYYWMGIIQAITTWGRGITDAVADFAHWLEFEFFGGLFAVGVAPIEAAWESNEAFIQSFGVFAQVVALIEAFVLVLLILWVFSFLVSVLRGAMS